jgi:molecular chaperone HscB
VSRRSVRDPRNRPAFRIDLPAVEQRHRDLSRALHPDKFAGAPAAERRLALNRAIEVNEAWRAVRDPPIRRAEALMRRAGVPVGEVEEPKPSPDLLMEMMESREALAEAVQTKDLAAVKRLGEEMSARMDATLLALGRGFAEAGADRAKLSALLPRWGSSATSGASSMK